MQRPSISASLSPQAVSGWLNEMGIMVQCESLPVEASPTPQRPSNADKSCPCDASLSGSPAALLSSALLCPDALTALASTRSRSADPCCVQSREAQALELANALDKN